MCFLQQKFPQETFDFLVHSISNSADMNYTGKYVSFYLQGCPPHVYQGSWVHFIELQSQEGSTNKKLFHVLISVED